MQADKVPYFILDLLQQVPTVYVKGLGRFDAIFHPAVIALPESKVKPPFIKPDFSVDQEGSSEVLAKFMHYVSGDEISKAEVAIDEFVQKVILNTSEGNTFAIEKFGTFSRTATDNIRFTPDWDAFNLSFSGLEVLDIHAPAPPVKSYEPLVPPPALVPVTSIAPVAPIMPPVDIVLENELSAEAASESVSEEVAREQANIEESTLKLWWIILSSALILIAVLCAYLAWDILSSRHKLDELKQIYPDTMADTSPKDIPQVVDSTPVIVDNMPIEQVSDSENSETITPEIGDNSKTCFIVVGAFSDPSNVSKMTDRLTAMGYTSEHIKGGSLTRVAIRTSCEAANLQKILNDARSSINPEAWIY